MRLLTALAHEPDLVLHYTISELALSTGHSEVGVAGCRVCWCAHAAVVNYYVLALFLSCFVDRRQGIGLDGSAVLRGTASVMVTC